MLDVLACVEDVAARLEPVAARHHIALVPTGDHAKILGVPRLLDEIVYNLCDNAVKYNVDGGSVTISVIEKEHEVLLQVRDTGIGIAKEHQNRVFERFYRVDKSHSKEIGGTGLGLSIVKHAAMVLGATVELDSVPGKGTTVTIRFPHP